MEKDSDFRILLVGRTGHGKSSTGNSIVGKDVFEVSASSRSKTKTCQWSNKFQRFGKVVEVVDTPGLFDTDLDQLAVHKELLKALVLTTPGFHVIAFVLMKGKFTEEIQKTQDLFFQWFGKDVEKFACIILTDTDSDEDKESYIKDDPHPKLAELVQTCNDNVVALNNKNSETKKQDQINKLFEVVEKIKRDNSDTHFSNVIFQFAESYMKSKYPNKLTKDSIRIIERFDLEQLSQCQRHRLQQLMDMLTEYDDSEDLVVETDVDSTDNDQLFLRKADEETDFVSSGSKGNLQIFDSKSNERILNIQDPDQVLRHKKMVTGSDEVASSNEFGYSFNTANTDEVPGKSSEYVASNVVRDQIDAKQHSTYQIESDEHSALMQGSSQSKTDNNKYREKKGRSRGDRVIDIESVSYDVPPCSPLDDYKDRVNNGEHVEEELKGLLGYFKKVWRYCKRKRCIIL
ncbi:GTPase IMAP family member 9-like [Ruditapes philippinarum]|uniref:GTPase IMAP family member 9-like n=1 Tax=Ruditapes philippinarum TaxID=129788 RepID=UPI00295B12BD|nr:GTPase IMAP family member 9-like [Ruditapes philippinarum]